MARETVMPGQSISEVKRASFCLGGRSILSAVRFTSADRISCNLKSSIHSQITSSLFGKAFSGMQFLFFVTPANPEMAAAENWRCTYETARYRLRDDRPRRRKEPVMS